jgi:hypothetical protein
MAACCASSGDNLGAGRSPKKTHDGAMALHRTAIPAKRWVDVAARRVAIFF